MKGDMIVTSLCVDVILPVMEAAILCFLPANQQRQSTEGKINVIKIY